MLQSGQVCTEVRHSVTSFNLILSIIRGCSQIHELRHGDLVEPSLALHLHVLLNADTFLEYIGVEHLGAQALECITSADFEDAIRNAISIGGDSDTIAAIAGGVAEALFGIPEGIARTAWGKLPEDVQAILTDLYVTAEHRSKFPETASITVVQGNIIDQSDCDVLVNAANEHLRAGSGVCGAIHSAAGPELEAYSHKLAPLPLGDAVVTPGFRLPQRRVIHTRGPKYLFDPEPAKHLALAMTHTLLLADREKLERIAVPAISTGVYAYPPAEAVPILVQAAQAALPRLHHLREIRFVAWTRELANIFCLDRW